MTWRNRELDRRAISLNRLDPNGRRARRQVLRTNVNSLNRVAADRQRGGRDFGFPTVQPGGAEDRRPSVKVTLPAGVPRILPVAFTAAVNIIGRPKVEVLTLALKSVLEP